MVTASSRLGIVSLATLMVAAAEGCTTGDAATNLDPMAPAFAADRAATMFVIGPLALTGIESSFPGGNWHIRDVGLTGPVSGDLTGVATITLQANMDGFAGAGPASGRVAITTSAGELWEGNLTGRFESDAPVAIRLFSRVVLHGPGSRTLRAECDETSSTSETLACTGDILTPGR